MRTLIGICLALLMVLGVTLTPSANSTSVDRYSFTRPPAPESAVDPKDRLSLDIERWSDDAARDRLFAAQAESGQDKLLDAFYNESRAGILRWPGGLQYDVRYAHRRARPDGGTDVVLVVDRPLWMWWEPKPVSNPYPFTVLQLRLDKNGRGEGRASFGVSVSRDQTFGIALADYAQAPAVLTDVRRERTDS